VLPALLELQQPVEDVEATVDSEGASMASQEPRAINVVAQIIMLGIANPLWDKSAMHAAALDTSRAIVPTILPQSLAINVVRLVTSPRIVLNYQRSTV